MIRFHISFTNGLSLKSELIFGIVLFILKLNQAVFDGGICFAHRENMGGYYCMKKMLIVYYSWSNGNTKRIAELLQEKTDADIVRIDTVEPYKGSYKDVVNQGQKEVNSGYKPPIQKLDVCPDDYDVIAIGTPTWWYTMAPAVRTFIEENNFKGKTVIPFMTNGGWAGHVIKDMADASKGAKVCHEMEIKFSSDGGDTLETPKNVINKWISEVAEFLTQERK